MSATDWLKAFGIKTGSNCSVCGYPFAFKTDATVCAQCEAKQAAQPKPFDPYHIAVTNKIPIPEHPKAQPVYPWKSLAVGDSFLMSDTQDSIRVNSLRGSVSRAAKVYGMKFTTHHSEEGLRVWRVQ